MESTPDAVMKHTFLLLGLVATVLVGCSLGSSDLSQEKSPNATVPDKKSAAPSSKQAQRKTEFKTSKVGEGDEVRRIDTPSSK